MHNSVPMKRDHDRCWCSVCISASRFDDDDDDDDDHHHHHDVNDDDDNNTWTFRGR